MGSIRQLTISKHISLKNSLVFGDHGTLKTKRSFKTEIIMKILQLWMQLYSLIKRSFDETLRLRCMDRTAGGFRISLSSIRQIFQAPVWRSGQAEAVGHNTDAAQ
jgi:hypothetical protein